jgi:uncharacterized RmlC-like cupin family protein
MTDLWHQPLRHIRGADLTGDTNQTSGMKRLEAISGKTVGSSKVWMGETHVAPKTSSGDYVFVPPYVPHREDNPTGEEAVVIIARSSQEGVVVNLPSLWSPVDVPED